MVAWHTYGAQKVRFSLKTQPLTHGSFAVFGPVRIYSSSFESYVFLSILFCKMYCSAFKVSTTPILLYRMAFQSFCVPSMVLDLFKDTQLTLSFKLPSLIGAQCDDLLKSAYQNGQDLCECIY